MGGTAEAAGSPGREPAQVRQYEVWWARLPEPVGRRPVMLLSRDPAYAYLSRVIVVEVTSTIRGIPVEVLLGRQEGCVADALPTSTTSTWSRSEASRRELVGCLLTAQPTSSGLSATRSVGRN